MGPEFVITIMVLAAAAIIVWSLVLRYKQQQLRHHERMAAIEKGAELPAVQPAKAPAPWSPRVYLLRGLIWLFTGFGLSAFILGIAISVGRVQESYADRLWRAIDLRRHGATEEEVKQLLNSKDNGRKGLAEAWRWSA